MLTTAPKLSESIVTWLYPVTHQNWIR